MSILGRILMSITIATATLGRAASIFYLSFVGFLSRYVANRRRAPRGMHLEQRPILAKRKQV